MKICPKCKKQLGNKARICRYCGADVSRVKIKKTSKPQVKTTIVNKEQNKDVLEDIKNENINNNIETKEDIVVSEKVNNTFEVNNKKKDNIFKIKFNFKKKDKVKKDDDSKNENNFFRKLKNSFLKHKLIYLICFVLLIVGIIFLILGTSEDYYLIVPGRKDQKTVFNMNDRIRYKDVYYTVTGVTTSMGTKYKYPKEGNQYVIVSLMYENRSDEKIRYSYQDWKMNNSLGEEKNRIFIPVNASSALFTGKLVVGGIKNGTVVYEEPIGDEGLELNFYEYVEPKEEDKEKEEIEVEDTLEEQEEEEEKEEEKPTPIFTVKIPKLGEAKTEE